MKYLIVGIGWRKKNPDAAEVAKPIQTKDKFTRIYRKQGGSYIDTKLRINVTDFNEKKALSLSDVDGDICYLIYHHWYLFPDILPPGCVKYMADSAYLAYLRWKAIYKSQGTPT